MNKPLQEAIHRLAGKLSDAARAGDWQSVHNLDAQVNRFLRSSQPVPADLRHALDRLEQAHVEALERAQAEAAWLSDRIQTLSSNREGLRAYEQSEEFA